MINLINEDIQSHVFGDIIKRQVMGELRVMSLAAGGWRLRTVGWRPRAGDSRVDP